MPTTQVQIEKLTATLAEVATAFMEEALEVASSPKEAEILATTAFLNYLSSAKPELFGQRFQLRNAAFASSLS